MRWPLPIDYMLGYTNNDMYAIIMGHISHKYAKTNRLSFTTLTLMLPAMTIMVLFHFQRPSLCLWNPERIPPTLRRRGYQGL